jgi:hypothetical protein
MCRISVASGLSRKIALLIVAGLAAQACDKVPLLAPSSSTISVTTPTSTLPIGGTTEISAFVAEPSGTPVQNGTTVRFTTNLGTLTPPDAQTRNGMATTTFTATTSGTATITAVSGTIGATPPSGDDAPASTNSVTITVGTAAIAAVTVDAIPSTVPPSGGTVELVATAMRAGGAPMPGVPVSFATTRGTLGSTRVITDANGDATTTLTTAETATVTVRAGIGSGTGDTATTAPTATVTVTARTGANVSLACAVGATTNCSNVTVGQLVTFTATRTATTTPTPTSLANGGNSIGRADRFRTAQEFSARLDFGDGESIDLGNFTSPTTVSHVYTRVGTFTARLIATDANGDQTTATQIVQVRGGSNGGGSFTVDLALSEPDDDGSATTARLDATATVSGIGSATVTGYTFSFPGGTPSSQTSTSNTASATYTSAGDKTVTVFVTLSDGRTATQTATRSVGL